MSNKENERYYLLPGMGGDGRRRKVKAMLGWGILAGLLASTLTALALYAIHHLSSHTP